MDFLRYSDTSYEQEIPDTLSLFFPAWSYDDNTQTTSTNTSLPDEDLYSSAMNCDKIISELINSDDCQALSNSSDTCIYSDFNEFERDYNKFNWSDSDLDFNDMSLNMSDLLLIHKSERSQEDKLNEELINFDKLIFDLDLFSDTSSPVDGHVSASVFLEILTNIVN